MWLNNMALRHEVDFRLIDPMAADSAARLERPPRRICEAHGIIA
jgi:hypothetical protein